MEITRETKQAHKATWWVYVDGQRIRRQATMRGTWGYDVTCSCGWDSKVGGGLKRYVEDQLWYHRYESQEG